MLEYNNAQICTNGHLATSNAEEYADKKTIYCSLCGSQLIRKCPTCDAKIPGSVKNYIGSYYKYRTPSYCTSCGHPFPWTKSKIDAAKEILTLSNTLSKSELESMDASYPDLIVDTPKTQVSAMKLQILLKKAGKITSDAVYSVFVDIASETAKKIIWPNS